MKSVHVVDVAIVLWAKLLLQQQFWLITIYQAPGVTRKIKLHYVHLCKPSPIFCWHGNFMKRGRISLEGDAPLYEQGAYLASKLFPQPRLDLYARLIVIKHEKL